MAERPAFDSRQYIVAFELRSIGDGPPDFEMPASLAGFDTGLFLPRDDPDWFGRSSYPPRILLLKNGELHVVCHPSTGAPDRRWALEQISTVESGHMLLKGWLRFTGSGFDYTVRYNTRGFRSILRFMHRLRGQLLGDVQPPVTAGPQLGPGLDIKFANALAQELDLGETVLMQAFQPPRELRSGTWLLPYRRWLAGDLLALTGRRLLWITDREKESHAPYGSIASYAPHDAVRSIGLAEGRHGPILQVDLNSGSTWQVPIAAEAAALVRTRLPYRCRAERTY
jgi:hypothetical protein